MNLNRLQNISNSVFIQNKYTDWYFSIVQNALMRQKNQDYYELHHILPKALFPEYSDLRKSKWNKVYLTAREHYICHLLLTKMTIGNNRRSMSYALWGMVNQKNKWQTRHITSSYIYEYAKREASKALSQSRKGKTLEELHGEEKGKHLRKIFRARKTRSSLSEEERKAVSERMKLAHKNNPWKRNFQLQKPPQKTCENCGKQMDIGNYSRHHGPKCKQYEIEKTCPTCQTPFMSKKREQKKFCSRICAGTLKP
jgi:hypothetical protein